jgi:hypothetical protein
MPKKITKKLMFFVESAMKTCLKSKRVKDSGFAGLKIICRWNYGDKKVHLPAHTMLVIIKGLDDHEVIEKEEENGSDNNQKT